MLIKTGLGVSQMSGTMGGVVASHNRFGQYFRSWRKPTDPKTASQVTRRAAMAAAVAAWKSLTDANRTSWNNYAAATPWSNRLGETAYLTGMQMFVRSHCYFAYLADETGSEPLVFDSVASLGGLPPNVTQAVASLSVATGLSLAFDDTAEWCGKDGNIAVVRMSLPRNETQVYGARGFRFVGIIVGGSVSPAESPFEAITADLPNAFSKGDRVTFGIRMIFIDGTLSEEIFVDAVANV